MLALFGNGELSVIFLLLDLYAQVLLILLINSSTLLVSHSKGVISGKHIGHQHVVV